MVIKDKAQQIILLTGPFLPGKKFGGPLKSILNLIDALGSDFEFKIVTCDRDLGSKKPYADVEIGKWNYVKNNYVFYLPKIGYFISLYKILKYEKYELIYCSSFWSKTTVIIQMLKYLGIVKTNVIVAPRGEFEPAALEIKAFKKKLFLFLYKLFLMQSNIVFTCTSEHDKKNIEKSLGKNIEIHIAGNIPDQKKIEFSERVKSKNILRIATVSRICRIKNIKYSIDIIDRISEKNKDFEKIIFHIYGHIEDRDYYEECKLSSENIIKRDSRIEILFKGSIEYNEVLKILSNYHIFLFPSKSENYGHVIHEAILAGCPVVISDTTPWRGLEEKGIGYDIALNNTEKFQKIISYFIDMDNDKYSEHKNNVYDYASLILNDKKSKFENINLIKSSISGQK
ncbi:MAG: glycosyltransferase [Bacteroidales bacterium]